MVLEVLSVSLRFLRCPKNTIVVVNQYPDNLQTIIITIYRCFSITTSGVLSYRIVVAICYLDPTGQ
jgi:hypothetical protein